MRQGGAGEPISKQSALREKTVPPVRTDFTGEEKTSLFDFIIIEFSGIVKISGKEIYHQKRIKETDVLVKIYINEICDLCSIRLDFADIYCTIYTAKTFRKIF